MGEIRPHREPGRSLRGRTEAFPQAGNGDKWCAPSKFGSRDGGASPRVELEGLVLNRRHIGKALGCGASAWDHAYASAMTREGGWRCTMDGQVGYNHNLALLFPRVLKRYYQGQSVCPSLQGEQAYL